MILDKKAIGVFAMGFFAFMAVILGVMAVVATEAVEASENYPPVISAPFNRRWTIANVTLGFDFTEQKAIGSLYGYDPEDGDITEKIVMTGFETVDTWHLFYPL